MDLPDGDYVAGYSDNQTYLGANETKSCAARGMCNADLTQNVATTITAYVAFSYWCVAQPRHTM